MCEQFSIRLSDNIIRMLNPSIRVRRIDYPAKLMYLLCKYQSDCPLINSQKWNDELYSIDDFYPVPMLVQEHRDNTHKTRRIIHTDGPDITVNRYVYSDNHKHLVYWYNMSNLKKVEIPKDLCIYFNLYFDQARMDRSIVESVLTALISKEVMELCELNNVFGPVVEVPSSWIIKTT